MEDVVVYGLLRGGIFAMAAFGFSLVLGVIGIVNFAHGALVVFGGLATQYLSVKFGMLNLLALGFAAIYTGLLDVLISSVIIAFVSRDELPFVMIQPFGFGILISKIVSIC